MYMLHIMYILHVYIMYILFKYYLYLLLLGQQYLEKHLDQDLLHQIIDYKFKNLSIFIYYIYTFIYIF